MRVRGDWWMVGMAVMIVAVVAVILGNVVTGGRWLSGPSLLVPSATNVLRVYVDEETGCQYLGPQEGGITPRLDATGRHLCRRPQ